MTPIEQEDAVTDALAAALDVIVTDGDGDQWRLVPMTLDGGLSPATLASLFVDPVADALAASGYAIVRSDELTRLRVALEVAADDVTTYMHRKGCWHESHAWERIERWLVKRWTLRAAPEKGAPR